MYLEVKVKGRKGKEAVSEQETTKQEKMSLISAISRSGERMRFLRSPEYMRRFYGENSEQYQRFVAKRKEED